MKHIKKIFAIALAAVMLLSCVPSAFAATSDTSVIDPDADASLTIYAFDWTNAYKDNVVDEDTFVSSGWQDSVVEDTFINATPVGGSPEQVLGNSQTGKGYAIKGAEFTIANVAFPITFPGISEGSQDATGGVVLLYAFSKDTTADLLTAIGLPDGRNSVNVANYNAEMAEAADYYWFYTSKQIIDAFAQSLETNSTEVKDALESYLKNVDSIIMEKTDEDGRTSIDGLDVGLYLVVETAVPEMVTATTNPFFISLPMTTVNNNTEGTAPEGGHEWNYDVTVYPKNSSGIPTLEKLVREAKHDTGKNNGFTPNTSDGFGHIATGSAGDTMEYEIISTLPSITSQATALSTYNFFDSIAPGMTYNKDVKITFFTDNRLLNKVTTWEQGDGRFTVDYSDDGLTMTIDITEAGLAEINGDFENVNGSLYAGYSNYTVAVNYSADINSDTSFVYGEEGNCNKVVLTWKRTSGEYYDTLIDDCHVFSFGMNLSKEFIDMSSKNAEEEGMFDHVKFVIKNGHDNYWVTAELNNAENVYYVTGHVENEEDATVFTPVTHGGEYGKIIVRGLEDDEYEVFEIETADGYTLLQGAILVDINYETNENDVCDIYSQDVLGLLQNDPRYAFDGGKDLRLANIPQKNLEHCGITAYSLIDNVNVTMLADEDSANAEVSLLVVNTPGFDLPQTGDNGVWMYGVAGGTLMLAAVLVIFFAFKKKEDQQTVQQ